MGCGSRLLEQDIITKLLENENTEFTCLKENEISSWNLNVTNLHNNAPVQTKIPNKKSKVKFNNGSRSIYGYKPNNKVNSFNFKCHDSIDDYLIQYRNENKTIRCLSEHGDLANNRETFNKPHKDLIDSMVTDLYPLKPDPPEKSLIHQVKFWQNQNSEFDKYRQISISNDNNDIQRSLIGPQVVGSLPTSTIPTSFGQRSSFHNKRNLDMIVPQGTTYDILSDDNRLSGNIEIDKLTVNIKERTHSFDGLGLMSIPFQGVRETTKTKFNNKEGGSLEFARLLDEKLRILYEQRNTYQPTVEISRPKPENKAKKPVNRQKSANNQIRNDYLNNLSINGRSTGAFGKSSIISVPKTAEEQLYSIPPCLLPQMPAFGTQNFPRFINSSVNFCNSGSYFNYSNINIGNYNSYRLNSEHDE